MRRSVFAAAWLAVSILSSGAPEAVLAQPSNPAAAKPSGPGYLGIHGEPLGGTGPGLRVTAVDPGSPAEKQGIAVGDVIRTIYVNNMTTWIVRQNPVDKQEDLDAFLAKTPIGTRGVGVSGQLRTVRLGSMTIAPLPEGSLPPAQTAAIAAPTTEAIEATRTTYLNMCGRGSEKLGVATCAGLKSDLDGAVAQRAAADHAAEVMASYRQLCGAGATAKLSKETCDGILAEAGGSPAAVSPPVAARPAAPSPVRRQPF